MRWPRFARIALFAVRAACHVVVLLCVVWGAGPAAAADLRIAVAANFRAPLEALVAEFTSSTGHDVTISSGATGLLYAQITRGAPFDVFLAADMDRPRDLVDRRLAVAGSLRVYAIGQLVVLSASGAAEVTSISELARLDRVAIANPRTAPYGRAAEQVLAASNIDLTGRLAFMQNVSGVVAAVRSGAAQAGFAPRSATGSFDDNAWLAISPDLHDPIEQGAVLLTRAEDNIAATAFLDYLASEDALSTMREFGYSVD